MMDPVSSLRSVGFYVLRDSAAPLDMQIPNRGLKVAALFIKAKPTEFRTIGKMVQGIGRAKLVYYMKLREKLGVDVWLAFYEKSCDKVFMQDVSELNLKYVPCMCAACRMHNYKECIMEAGGMVFFEHDRLIEFGKKNDHLLKELNTSQLSMF